MSDVTRFAYKLSTPLMILCTTFFILCTAAIFHELVTLYDGPFIDRLSQYTEATTPFHLGLGLASILFVIFGVIGVVASLTPRTVSVGTDYIDVPGSFFSSNSVMVPYDTITGTESINSEPFRIFTIRHTGGRIQFRQILFSDTMVFNDLVEAVTKAISDYTMRETR